MLAKGKGLKNPGAGSGSSRSVLFSSEDAKLNCNPATLHFLCSQADNALHSRGLGLPTSSLSTASSADDLRVSRKRNAFRPTHSHLMVTHRMKKELQEAFPNRGILDTKKDEYFSK